MQQEIEPDTGYEQNEPSVRVRLGNLFWGAVGTLTALAVVAAVSAILVARQEGVVTRVLLDERLRALGQVFERYIDAQAKLDFQQDDRLKMLEQRQGDVRERLRGIEESHEKMREAR